MQDYFNSWPEHILHDQTCLSPNMHITSCATCTECMPIHGTRYPAVVV